MIILKKIYSQNKLYEKYDLHEYFVMLRNENKLKKIIRMITQKTFIVNEKVKGEFPSIIIFGFQ